MVEFLKGFDSFDVTIFQLGLQGVVSGSTKSKIRVSKSFIILLQTDIQPCGLSALSFLCGGERKDGHKLLHSHSKIYPPVLRCCVDTVDGASHD